MTLATFLLALFTLPGFFSFIIVQTFTIGFGKKSSAFEKTYYALLFDIPIFLVTLLMLNNNCIIDLIDSKKEPYSGFNTIEQFVKLFSNDINRIIYLSVIVLGSSILVGFGWIILIKLTAVINNIFRKSKIVHYNNLWKQIFVKSYDSFPLEIYNLKEDQLVVGGFLQEVSSSLEEEIEFKIFEVELFTECKNNGYIKEIDFVYINQEKNLKVVVYNQNKIDEIFENNKKEKEGIKIWGRKIVITISTSTMKLVKELQKRIQRK